MPENSLSRHVPKGSSKTYSARWCLEDLDFSAIGHDCLRDREDLFLLVCCASFIESGADTYSRNLREYFSNDPEMGAWLREQWEMEELQHGLALKAYVNHAWPDFDWESAYSDFFAEYGRLCVAGELEPTRGQELVARCIVEMGTTTYYQALNAVSEEPVLRKLTWLIRSDEVRHYKFFHRHILKYRELEGLHRGQVIAALWRRMRELRQSDADVAFRHAVSWRYRGEAQTVSARDAKQQAYGLMRSHYPIDLAARMALKPLLLGPRWQHWLERPTTAMARWVMLG